MSLPTLSEIKGDILIVDDDLPSLRMLSNWLETRGFDIRSARDGSTALLMIAAEPPDLILLDIQMPDMDGYQVCERLKANSATQEIPVLFISARDTITDKVRGFNVGAVDYIEKPYHLEEVMVRIKSHLTISRLRAKNTNQLNEFSTLQRISKAIAETRELSQALELICQTIRDHFGAQLTFIAVKKEDSAELKGLFGCDQMGETISLATKITLHIDLIPDQMMDVEGKSITFTKLQSMPIPEKIHHYLQENNIQSGFITPLKHRGTFHGFLLVAKEGGSSHFKQNELDLAEKIATDISVAIENDSLNEQARLAAVDAERQRLARELHDSVTQSIYSLTLHSSGWESMSRQGALDDPADAFRRLGAIGQQALKEMRLLLHQLRPSILEEQGLIRAIQQRLDTVERRSSIEPALIAKGDFNDMPPKIEDELFSIIQEALNNSLRHAMAESVVVKIEADRGRITVSVEDDGVGFNPSIEHSGMGLRNMRERANSISGDLSIQSKEGHGTRVRVTVNVN